MLFKRLHPHHVAWLIIAVLLAALWFRYSAPYAPWKPLPKSQIQRHEISQYLPSDFLGFIKGWKQLSRTSSVEELMEHSQFKYSPGLLAVFSLLSHDSPIVAWFVYSTFCILLLGLTLFLGFRYATWRSVGMLLVGLVLAWNGFLGILANGQLEILILAIAVGAGAILKDWPFFSGLLLGCLPWFKLPWILLVFPFMLMLHSVRRRFRLFFSGYLLSCFIWAAMVPSLILGPERAILVSQKWFTLLQNQSLSLYLTPENQSVWVSAIRWFEGNMELALGVACLLTSVILARFTIRSALTPLPTKNVFAWLSPWLVLNQVLTPMSWRWGSIFLLGMPFAIRYSVRGKWARISIWVLVTILWMIQMNWFIQIIGLGVWNDLYLYGYITFFWLVLLVLAS
ncbi:hypothetical protein K2X30_12290 [bacterium]|jgi:hypothetical protein|nr:hypothetical protein [bacterium]